MILEIRADYCIANKLCFVSLQRLEKDGYTLIKHPIAGVVSVKNKFIHI